MKYAIVIVGMAFSFLQAMQDEVQIFKDAVVINKQGDEEGSFDESTESQQSLVTDYKESSALSQTTLIKRSVLCAKSSLEEQVYKNVQTYMLTFVHHELPWYKKLCGCRNRKR